MGLHSVAFDKSIHTPQTAIAWLTSQDIKPYKRVRSRRNYIQYRIRSMSDYPQMVKKIAYVPDGIFMIFDFPNIIG